MAKCDEGYLCEVCGQDVAELTDSDLYLRYVIGLLDPETLHTTRERHIRCNPVLAQYIVHQGAVIAHVGIRYTLGVAGCSAGCEKIPWARATAGALAVSDPPRQAWSLPRKGETPWTSPS